MMSRARVLMAMLVLLACCQSAVAVSSVTFFFNPADFLDYRPLEGVDDTWSFDGGMFKLHKVWNGDDQWRSWLVSDRVFMETFANCLGPNEGIGYFNIDLHELGIGQLWGQTMQTPLQIDAVFAPPGWSTEISGLNASWTANYESLRINGNTTAYDDDRSFGFRFTVSDCANCPIPIGESETIWFGGYNWSPYAPALEFDQWGTSEAGTFASIDGNPGTGFEATLKLVSAYSSADFDEDGDVDGRDFLVWQQKYKIESGALHTDGDANNDEKVNQLDLNVWKAEYGSVTPVSSLGVPIPEPASLFLMTLGILLTAGYSARRRFGF